MILESELVHFHLHLAFDSSPQVATVDYLRFALEVSVHLLLPQTNALISLAQHCDLLWLAYRQLKGSRFRLAFTSSFYHAQLP